MITFRAMGTDVSLVAPSLDDPAEAELGERIARLFADTERRFSRFRADSELARLNRGAGRIVVSEPMFEALRRARRYVELTGGLFDPAIGPALCAAGYDRPFALGALDRGGPPGEPPPRASLREVALDEAAREVDRPAHVRLDLGGFIKGWTADQAARMLPCPGVVDAGGDAVLRGDGPSSGEGWLVDVEDPFDAERVVLTLRARDRAVATSAPNRRRWSAGGHEYHHLIDQRTGRPAASDLAQATVLADSAELADVLAKCVFLLGSRRGRRFLEGQPRTAGVLVTREGSVQVVGDLEVCDE